MWVSGVLTAILMTGNFGSSAIGSFIFNFSPGILFGLALAIFFYFYQGQRNIYKLITLIIVSAVAYYAACIATVKTPFHIKLDPLQGLIDPTIFFSGGVIGSLILCFAIKFLPTSLKYKQLVLLVILGGLLGTFGWLGGSFFSFSISDGYGNLPPANLYSLYIVWQTGIILTIALCLRFNKKELLLSAAATGNTSGPSTPTPKKWYQHTGLVAIFILACLTFLVSWLYFYLQKTTNFVSQLQGKQTVYVYDVDTNAPIKGALEYCCHLSL